nr:uncharacterized protein LOC117277909 [Nicotiana tomentosiformis]
MVILLSYWIVIRGIKFISGSGQILDNSCNSSIQTNFFQVLSSIIVWELRKRRNNCKYGEIVTVSRVIYQVSSTLQAFFKVRKPGLKHVPHKWSDLLQMLEQCTPRLKVTKVLWEIPLEGWIKVNTDGAARGNPGRSAIGCCLRDDHGDVIHAHGQDINETTNTKAETSAILEALRFCKHNHISHIWLQTDSLLLKNVIEGTWSTPWGIVEYVEEIWRLMEMYNARITHI